MQSLWHIFHVRKRTPFYVDMYTHGIAYVQRRIFDFSFYAKLYHVNGSVTIRRSEFEQRKRSVWRRIMREPNFLLRVMTKHYRDYITRFAPLWKKIGRLPVRRMTNHELAEWLRRYAASVSAYWAVGLIPLYVEEQATETIERFLIRRLSSDDAAKALQTFLTSRKEGVVGAEYRSLLTIATLPLSKQEKALDRHAQQFSWMDNQLYTHTFTRRFIYEQRLRSLARKRPRKLLANYQRERRTLLASYRSWMRRLAPPARIRALIDSLNEAMYYRSWRQEKAYESGFIVAPLLKEIARRLHISMHDFLFCLPREIGTWLTTGRGVQRAIIRARQKGFVYIPTRGGSVLTGLAVSEWSRRIHENIKRVREVRGKTAYPGMVRGRACVVFGKSDFRKIKQGDILVTPSTTPLYSSILGKIRAIITDEGGVLSHASIISRELKIPCVIGTKIATKIFKDGNRVEMDANRGLIRKIH